MSEALPEQSPPVPLPGLSDSERSSLGRMLGFPLDLPPEFVTWLEGRMQLLLSAGNIQGLQQRVAVVGDLKMILKDLSAAGATLTPYEDAQGRWLYCNGATFAAADYPKLNAFLGGLVLPDTLGRALWMTGTNAATDLLDNDGVAEASREPKHTHTSASLTVTGAPSAGTAGSLAVSGAPGLGTITATLSYRTGSLVGSTQNPTGSDGSGGLSTTGTNPVMSGAPSLGTLAISGAPGAPGLGSLDVGGTAGTGMSGSDAIAHCVVGSLLVKAD